MDFSCTDTAVSIAVPALHPGATCDGQAETRTELARLLRATSARSSSSRGLL